MYKQVKIEDWDIDFDQSTAQFTLDDSKDEEQFVIVEITLEQYQDTENPICVIDEITGCWLLEDSGAEVDTTQISDAEIDMINGILAKEYAKHLNR